MSDYLVKATVTVLLTSDRMGSHNSHDAAALMAEALIRDRLEGLLHGHARLWNEDVVIDRESIRDTK